MNKWKAWLGIAIVFITGVAVGAVGGKYYARYRFESPFQGPRKNAGTHHQEVYPGA